MAAMAIDSSSRPGAAQLPGPDLSRWPSHLVELVLCHLGTGDLLRAGRVCRHWHALARNHWLQVRCFLNNYPCDYWQRLKPALKTQRARHAISPWTDKALSQSPHRQAGQESDPDELFFALTRQMLLAPGFTLREGKITGFRGSLHPLHYYVCGDCTYSPDARLLAIPDSVSIGRTHSLGIWRQDTDNIDRVALCQPDGVFLFRALAFSPDSRSLSAVEDRGYLHRWEQQPDASWQAAARRRLCAARVDTACLSPDTNSLALQTVHEVLVMDTAAPEPGQPPCSFQWNPGQDINPAPTDFMLYLRRPDAMQFSADSQHFLFVSHPTAIVFDRHDGHWQAQGLCHQDDPSPYTAGALHPAGGWLALATRGSYSRFLCGRVQLSRFVSSGYSLELWRRTEDRQWSFSSSIRSAGAGYSSPPMRFSPDGRQLAFVDQQSPSTFACVSLLSRTDAGHWQLATRLPIGSNIPGPSSHGVIASLHYSVHGTLLTATSPYGVQLWQYLHGAWQAAAWIENDSSREGAGFALAPDGLHCAVHTGCRGNLHILGPGPGGKYQIKLRLTLGDPVYQVLFAPDGVQLLVSCYCYQRGGVFNRVILLHLTPPEDRPASGQQP